MATKKYPNPFIEHEDKIQQVLEERKWQELRDKELEEKNKLKFKRIQGNTSNQKHYIDQIFNKDIVSVVGPPGAGKTMIAVGVALEFLERSLIDKIILTRPIVEAGNERIGFLPGSLEEKVNPYIQPLLDYLEYFCIKKSDIKRVPIDIVPLGFMKGRTFHKCFIIADEMQNAKFELIEMLVTRIGEGSKMVITGDPSQSDLSYCDRGGLEKACQIFKLDYNSPYFGQAMLDRGDIMRHPAVARFLELKDQLEKPRTLSDY